MVEVGLIVGPIVAVLVLIIIILILKKAFIIIHQAEGMVIERFGKFRAVLTAGFHCIVSSCCHTCWRSIAAPMPQLCWSLPWCSGPLLMLQGLSTGEKLTLMSTALFAMKSEFMPCSTLWNTCPLQPPNTLASADSLTTALICANPCLISCDRKCTQRIPSSWRSML